MQNRTKGTFYMRKPTMDVNKVKGEILKLKGKYVEMAVNKGRRKITKYEGVLEDIYNSVFVVKVMNVANVDKLSYSYSDVLCGDVKIAQKEVNQPN